MADLRDSHNFAFKGELDHAVAMAVKTMGPKAVLSVIPLQITGDKYVLMYFNTNGAAQLGTGIPVS